jgi:predicted DNA-binding protein with PD1-like motif
MLLNKNMNKNEFIEKLSNLHFARSIQKGVLYTIKSVNERNVEFVREGKTKSEKIRVDELYNLFNHQGKINTSIAKDYIISGRVQSPSTAFVLKLKSTL